MPSKVSGLSGDYRPPPDENGGEVFRLSRLRRKFPTFNKTPVSRGLHTCTHSQSTAEGVQVRWLSISIPSATTGVGRAAGLQHCFWFCFLCVCGFCRSSPSILIPKMAPHSLYTETICELCRTCMPEVAMSRVAGVMHELVSFATGNRYLGGWGSAVTSNFSLATDKPSTWKHR